MNKGQGKSTEAGKKVNTGEFSVQQPLENPFKRKYRIRIFEKEWKAALYSFNFSKPEVIYNIKNFFFDILLQKNLQQLSLRNLESIKKIHELIKKRVELGELKELEAIKLQVEILKAQNELRKTETELKLAKDNLNQFLGNVLSPDLDIKGKLAYKKLTIEEKSLVEKVLTSHPLLKKKEKEVEAAQSNIGFIKWQRIPDPKLKAFMAKEIDGQNKGFGLTMEIPLWNFKSKEIAAAENLFLKEKKELKAVKIELTTEVKNKFKKLKLSDQKIGLFQSGLPTQAE